MTWQLTAHVALPCGVSSLCAGSGGPVILIRDWKSVSRCKYCLTWFGVSLVYRGWGVPFWFGHKFGGPITFDSRSGVSSLDQVWFWAFLWFLSVDRRSRGGGCWLIFRLWAFRFGSSFGVSELRVLFCGVFTKGVSSDDGWLDIVFSMVGVAKESILGDDVIFGGCLEEVFIWILICGYGIPSICGTVCILFRPYLASCGVDV